MPLTPAKEYIRANSQVIAIENAQVVGDGTFETGSLGPWITIAGNASAGTVAHTGSYGLSLGGTTAQSWVYQDSGGFVPGQMYKVSVWVKSSTATTNGVGLWLHDTLGNGATGTNAYPGTGWQQISTAFTATATGQMRIHLVQFPGTAETTYWDDVTVTPLPPNGDFETGSLSPWIFYSGNAGSSSISHSGFYGLMMGGTTNQSLVYQDFAGLIPGQMYQVSVWVKSSSSSTNGVALWVLDTQGNNSVVNNLSPTTGWQQISGAFTATSIGTLRIHLIQWSGTAETTYWDDVTITPLPPNGNFETGALSPWILIGGNAAVGTTAHGGAYGATLGGTTAQSWIYQDVSGLIPGQVYRVTAWVKSTTATTNGGLWIHDTQGNNLVSAAIAAGTAWQQLTASFTATSTGKLRIHLLQSPNQTATTYWDDVAVVPASGTNSANAMMAVSPTPSTPSYLPSPNARLAAGSSKDAAKPVTQMPPVPANTAKAKGSSADPVLPGDKTLPFH